MKKGDLVKYKDNEDLNRWIPREPEYFEVVAALESTIGVVISDQKVEANNTTRCLIHWLDIGRATYENVRYLEVVS